MSLLAGSSPIKHQAPRRTRKLSNLEVGTLLSGMAIAGTAPVLLWHSVSRIHSLFYPISMLILVSGIGFWTSVGIFHALTALTPRAPTLIDSQRLWHIRPIDQIPARPLQVSYVALLYGALLEGIVRFMIYTANFVAHVLNASIRGSSTRCKHRVDR